jgi:hypothetical protein
MAFKFTPKSEKDVSSGGFSNLPAGEYPFTVMESGIARSKSEKNAGREFIKLKLIVHGPDYDRHVFDMFADWFSEWKLKHFCETVNMQKEYLSGALNPDNNRWKDRQGFVRIKVTPAQGNYESKNEVVDYLPDDLQKCEEVEKAEPTMPPAPDDDVPF